MEQNKKIQSIIGGQIRAIEQTENETFDGFEAVFATETPVLRRDWNSDSFYYEVLSCKKEHVRSSRLDAGLPLFDNHPYDYSAQKQLGKSVEVRFENNQIIAKIKWGSRADEALKKDVEDKIISGVSCGYSRYAYIETKLAGDKYPTRTFTDWEVEEISLAPVPADVNSSIRTNEPIDLTEKKEQSFIEKLSKNFNLNIN